MTISLLANTTHIWNDVSVIPFIAVPINVPSNIPNVPFYSQFHDIQLASWQKKGCGVTSLAMVIDFYKPDAVSVNKLLGQAIASGAYDQNAGWIHRDLVLLAKKYGLDGNNYDLSKSDTNAALDQFKSYLKDGPVIASVHYKFDPKSLIPHIIVIDGINNDVIYYNDPASNQGEKQISLKNFLRGWKKRFIVVRPVKENIGISALTNFNSTVSSLNQNTFVA